MGTSCIHKENCQLKWQHKQNLADKIENSEGRRRVVSQNKFSSALMKTKQKINQDNKTSFLKLSVQPFWKKVVDQTSLLPHKNTIKLCGTIFFKIN